MNWAAVLFVIGLGLLMAAVFTAPLDNRSPNAVRMTWALGASGVLLLALGAGLGVG